MDFRGLLKKIAKILDELGIPYYVTGGVAVVTWGRIRFTHDIDIVVGLQEKKITSLAKRLRALGEGAYIDEDMALDALKHRGEFNFILPGSGIKVDFWILKSDPLSKLQLSRGITKKVGGQPIKFLSPEDLILSKLAWYKESMSSRHLEDAQSVIAIQNKKLDKEYLQQWAGHQDTLNILNQILG